MTSVCALPVNPSGGLKAKGHPPGATGVAQCELSRNFEGRRSTRWTPRGFALAAQYQRTDGSIAVTILEGPANGAG